MPTRTSHRWESLPGNFDRHHTFALYPATNDYGIPSLLQDNWIPKWLQPYGVRVRTSELPDGGAMHFFLDDYRFEVLWNRPWTTLPSPRRMGFALAPDFSVYRDWPIAIQIYNVYRNRWMGRFWQEQGIRVIPTVVWGDQRSYDFCFAGIEKGSVVACSSVGVRSGEDLDYFAAGYEEMVRRLAPAHIVFYGNKLDYSLRQLAPYTTYPTFWETIRKVKKTQQQVVSMQAETPAPGE